MIAADRSASGSPGTAPGPRAPADLDSLWDFDHPDTTEARFRAMLPAARAAFAAKAGTDLPDASVSARGALIELLTQIARAQGLQRRFEGAHATLDEAKRLLRADLERARVRVLLERGRVFNSSRHPGEARPLFLAAWDLARTSGQDALAVDAAHMVAIVETPENALEWNLRALALAESSQDHKANRWLGSLYNNIGWTYHDARRYEEALPFFVKAHAWRRDQGQAEETRIARWCVGRCLRSMGRVTEALGIQEDLLKGREAAGAKPDGFILEEMGECLLALDRAAEARPWFQKAYEILSSDPWLAEREPGRLRRLAELGGGSKR